MAKVAIVDDEKAVRDLLTQHLSAAGHKCVTVTNGGRAFETLRRTRPDVILVDLMMSEVSGFRLCRMIREDRILYRTPVIVLAGAEDEPEVLYCKRMGADDFLAVPIRVEELMAKVDDILVSYAAVAERDPATGLSGLEAVKVELNHKLARGEGVAACYLGISNLRKIVNGQEVKTVAMNEIARDIAGLIHTVAEDLGIYEMLVGYVGAAYFVIVLKLDEYENFCERFVKRFDSEFAWHRKRQPPTWANGGTGAWRGNPARPEISIGVVHNGQRKYRSADTMLRMLSRVLREAQESPGSSYFVCRCPVAL